MMQNLVTIAIHQQEKAIIAKNLLEQYGITVTLEEIVRPGDAPLDYHVKVEQKDVNRAINIIGASKQLSYSGRGIFQHDDGRNRVLVAVDFSENSFKACETAFQYAKSINAKVKILNVFSNMRYPLHMPFADVVRGDESSKILDKARKNMLDLCQEINNKIANGELPSVNYSYSLREGIVEEEIETFVEEYKPVLLVVGTKGMSNNSSYFMGNVTADIIEVTNVPVLTVPLKGKVNKLEEIKHIGYLTSVDKKSMESFANLVRMTQDKKDVRITLIHANNTSKSNKFSEKQLEDIQEYFQSRYPEQNISYKVIDSGDKALDALETFIEEENISMLCVNTRRRNILGRIFMPSMSRKLLKSIDIHLLVLRN